MRARHLRPARHLAAGLSLALAAGLSALAGAPPAQAGPPVVDVRTENSGECSPDQTLWLTREPLAFARMGVAEAQRLSTGDGVVVAVLDSGVAGGNAHLDGVLVGGTNLADGGGGADEDVYGHGTAIAGQVAAQPVDGSGVVGVAPGARIMPVRLFVSDQDPPTPARIAEGIEWAAEHGADIINVSLSTASDDPALARAVRVAQNEGALVVASTGNRGTTENQDATVRYPAAFDGVLGVAAVDQSGAYAADASFASEFVDVVAPGSQVDTTYLDVGDCTLDDGHPSSSYATGYVSGVAALIASAYPDESPEQWAYRIMVTAMRADPSARTDETGWGEIRPYEALSFIDDGTAPGPDSPSHERREEVNEDPEPLTIADVQDPWADDRRVVTWVLLGTLAVSLVALVLGRMGSAPRRRR
ncbi:MAG TPA: S8 family serine peptidase [Candidatus Ruania gallistercoris]|uniref:S8 family serine peptidase n=1 Tax=Candidatus Ruania gallistercoris TaxID=2838746 RepID=A0A9D2EBR4_9MICO|nr:S8 family serine peptidase [Candidatus Ruania gallistercoris]